jgi:3,4-dihydroxy 2-butanone 4-phosphate synthase / GTP cyclohydrolase II
VSGSAAREAIRQLADGRPIVLIDDAAPGEGAVVFAGQAATPELVAMTVRHTCGYLRAVVTDARASRLDLPSIATGGGCVPRYAVSVDARRGISTGISATDRAHTFRTIAARDTEPSALTRPGHVVVERVDLGVLNRESGIGAAALWVAVLGGVSWCVGVATLVSPLQPTRMAQFAEAREFANQHGLSTATKAEIVALATEAHGPRRGVGDVRSSYGTFESMEYRTCGRDGTNIVLRFGATRTGDTAPLLRVHRECLSGNIFGSDFCSCADDLKRSLQAVAASGNGVLAYLRSFPRNHDGAEDDRTPQSDITLLDEVERPALLEAIRRMGSVL